MNLRLVREPSMGGATLGVLFVDGHFECFSLEDEIREIPGQPVEAWKITRATAIPAGRYRLAITPSQRFLRDLPLLVDVPGFTGVRMHPGNTVEDTAGCLLVGKDRQRGRVLQSRVAFETLFAKLSAVIDSEPITIGIENPV